MGAGFTEFHVSSQLRLKKSNEYLDVQFKKKYVRHIWKS